MVGPNAPFRGVTFQPLTPGVAFGTLRFVPGIRAAFGGLGAARIVMTDQVPNDIPLLGGLITESFQTPLAHVNVLAAAGGAPIWPWPGAPRSPPRAAPGRAGQTRGDRRGLRGHQGRPHRGIGILGEPQASRALLTPRLDLSARGVQPLADRGIGDLQRSGARPPSWQSSARSSIATGP